MQISTNQEMLSAVAWLSTFAGDAETRWSALAPLVAIAAKSKDFAAFSAILGAGGSPSLAIDQALAEDDPTLFPQLLLAAVTDEHGSVYLEGIHSILQKCAKCDALKCFEATAAVLRKEKEATLQRIKLSSDEAQNKAALETIEWPADDSRWIWRYLAASKSPSVRAALHSALSVGCGLDVSANAPRKRPESPLLFAIQEGNFDMADELLSMGAQPARSSLIAAIGCGNLDVLALVIRHAGVNPVSDGADDTPLEAAIVAANLDAIRMLLAAGADPNGLSSNRPSYREGFSMLRVLMSCPVMAINGCASQEDMCLALLAAGADPALVSAGGSPIEMLRPLDGRNHYNRALFELMEAELDRRALVAELESSSQPAARADAPKTRL